MALEIRTDNTALVVDEINDAVLRALEQIGMAAEGYAKDLCPVKTGLARNSITYAIGGEAPAISSYRSDDGSKSGTYSGVAPNEKNVVFIGSNVEYFPEFELGNAKQAAQPCLKPAVADHVQTYRKILEEELKNG